MESHSPLSHLNHLDKNARTIIHHDWLNETENGRFRISGEESKDLSWSLNNLYTRYV